MFSLFELDNIPEEEFLKEYPKTKGENEFQTRANITLILKDEEISKDCPLFNESNFKSFFRYLSIDLKELKLSLNDAFPGVKFPDDFVNKHRIIYIYNSFL